MRINKLEFIFNENENKRWGIRDTTLERLGQVVAIVGKNGCGKTRFLNLMIPKYPTTINFERACRGWITGLPDDMIAPFSNEHEEMLRNLQEIEEKGRDASQPINIRQNFLVQAQRIRQNKQFASALQRRVLAATLFEKHFNSVFASSIRVVNYDAIKTLSTTPAVSFEELVTSVDKVSDVNEFDSIQESAFTFLKSLPNDLSADYLNAKIEELEFKSMASWKRFSALQGFVKSLLNKELEWIRNASASKRTPEGNNVTFSGHFTFDSRRFNHGEFSEGEKILFAFAMLFFLLDQNPSTRIRSSIIVIDEPELHLHPSMEVALINGLRSIVGDEGQVWIATHSINILSQLQPDEIFMMKQGAITSPNRSVPGETLMELMGLDEHVNKLKDFINSISQWAYINFITQCFDDPATIESARENDPQVEAFKGFLESLSNGSVLLDFGAGKGRLVRELRNDLSKEKIAEIIALEPNEEHHQLLKASGELIVTTDIKSVKEQHVDVVVLCNVLHEIDVKKWTVTCNEIRRILKHGGYLLIIEDKMLPYGEDVAETGFHILDEESIQLLFGMDVAPTTILPTESKYQQRILCCPIQRSQMNAVTKQSVLAALLRLEQNIWNTIKAIRSSPIKNKSKTSVGREAAFYDQHYINTKLALEKLKSLS